MHKTTKRTNQPQRKGVKQKKKKQYTNTAIYNTIHATITHHTTTATPRNIYTTRKEKQDKDKNKHITKYEKHASKHTNETHPT